MQSFLSRSLAACAAVLFTPALASCGSDGGSENTEPDPTEVIAIEDLDFIDAALMEEIQNIEALRGQGCVVDRGTTYDDFGREFIDAFCIRCHSEDVTDDDRMGAPPNANYDTIEGVRERLSFMYSYAGDNNVFMPISPPMPSRLDRMRFGAWLACGAPQDSDLP
jgi:hypothetical protein